ncbi:hypothetical protein ECZU26_42120 [Escherichia coli]|nr:hypothetical protein ECZU26_42120 [Escherichia coli]
MRLAGIFAAFAEELIEGVEMLPAFSRSQSVQSPAHVRLAPLHAGLRLDSGRLFKGAKKPVAGCR